ncbi:MAG: alpha/beta fold hydrolase, partial [Actinomycetota bacterium]
TKVFVHGNPETAAIWQPLARELEHLGVNDILLLSPPGFGAPTPSHWSATQLDYAYWLISEIERLDAPIDIVGHDWGAGHVYGAIAQRPDLFASWAADCGGLLHPDYTWHDAAQAWQTPGVGEEAVGLLTHMATEDLATVLVSLGMTQAIATEVAKHIDVEMGRCILALYRSAAQPAMRDLGARLATVELPRGAVIIPTADTYPGTPDMANDVARSLRASTIELDDRGHWWMIEDPATAARQLVNFWNSSK